MSPLATPVPQDAHAIRPAFARNNTQVLVVDERIPEAPLDQPGRSGFTGPSGSRGLPSGYAPEMESPVDEPESYADESGLTLADIPQLLEQEQAREQRRSLPSQAGKPMLSVLTPLELLVIKHAAVLTLQRSPLKDQFDLDEILELIEVKKSTFWNKLFKGNDKKNVKKKGPFTVLVRGVWLTRSSRRFRSATRTVGRARDRFDAWSIPRATTGSDLHRRRHFSDATDGYGILTV